MVLAVVVVAPDTIPSASPHRTMIVPYTLKSVRESRASSLLMFFFLRASHSSSAYRGSSGEFCKGPTGAGGSSQHAGAQAGAGAVARWPIAGNATT